MSDALEFGFAYVGLVGFLAIVLQVMGGPRSRAGYWLVGIFILLPLFLVAALVCVIVDAVAGVSRRRADLPFRWAWTRWLFSRLTGPASPSPLRASELRTLGQLMQLTPIEFEFAVGDLLSPLSATSTLMGQAPGAKSANSCS